MAVAGSPATLTLENLGLLDDRIARILSEIDSKSARDIVDTLELEIDEECIEEAKRCVFKIAHEHYVNELKDTGVLVDMPVGAHALQVKKRRGVNAGRADAMDLLELYMYCVGYKKEFPKDVLTSIKNFVDIHTCSTVHADKSPADTDTRVCTPVSNVIVAELHVKLAELANTVRVLKEDIEKENQDKKSVINGLKSEVKSLQGELASIKAQHAMCNQCHCASKSRSDQPPKNGNIESVNDSADVDITASSSNVCDETAPKLPGHPTADEQQSNEEESEQAGQLRPYNNAGSNSAPELQNHANDQRAFSVEQPCRAEMAKNGTRRASAPTYSAVLQAAGTWNLDVNRKNQPSMGKGHSSKSSPRSKTAKWQSPQAKPRQMLRGCKPEKLATLYLENIQKSDDDNNQDILHAVKAHGRANGVRIVSAYTVRNRFCQDVVGCKIVIPVSQADKVMTPGFWAEEITCREWHREPPKRQHQGTVP